MGTARELDRASSTASADSICKSPVPAQRPRGLRIRWHSRCCELRCQLKAMVDEIQGVHHSDAPAGFAPGVKGETMPLIYIIIAALVWAFLSGLQM
jgi:hypothetical protein